MIEVGRICIKKKGREKGKYCIVLKKIDKNFVLITGPKKLTGVRRRKCNILHLEPTQHFLEIKEEMSDEEIIKLFEKENLIKKLELKKL
jgi:large subunit ribosomal protein L14e